MDVNGVEISFMMELNEFGCRINAPFVFTARF